MTKVRVRRSQLGFACWCFALLLGAQSAEAQSAADKATARKLATEGIELYQAGKYAEALDKLERAESLYDAPVHLLYIARAEQQLGKWVEAAETYRRLVRVKLGADAPAAFQQAIDEGKKELAELEPRIPVLKVEVTPAGVSGLEVSLDGEKIAAAAIGVDRPVDPGEHTLVASAQGYAPSEKKVTLAPGGKEALVMALVPTGEPTAPTTAPPSAKTPDESGGAPAPSGVSEKKAGFFVGLRLLGAIPAGQAGVFGIEGGPELELSMSDVMNGGGGLGLLGGFRFARHFAGKVYLDLFNMAKGDDLPGESRVSGVEGGLGFSVSTAAHQWGGFGEIGLGFQSFEVQNGVSIGDGAALCRGDVSLSGGPSLRIGGGGIIPIGKYFHITPFMLASFAQFDKATVTGRECDPVQTAVIESIEIQEARGHQLFLLGVGGDWLIGG